MSYTSNKELMQLGPQELMDLIPRDKYELFKKFVHEMNRREYEVRFQRSCNWDEFRHEANHDDFGYGFMVDGHAVPYFHPNRSFHDEIIWLNENVFYNPACKFEDMLINAAIVKFYGPSNTISLITEGTGNDFIVYDKLINDEKYVLQCMQNLENAKRRGEKIYGTTELRTSLQTESRNYTRQLVTPYDALLNKEIDPTRTSRSSDMFYWFTLLGPQFKDFYSQKPTMEQSFNFLSSFRGIGNYYGYHFSTNLARMPEIGTHHLLPPGTPSGNLSEDDDFVAPGVGAMITINWFYEHLGFSITPEVGANLIRGIRDNQDQFFDFTGKNKEIIDVISEIGKFTTFGCEISCCQFGVFLRLRDNKKLASKRSMAPISKEEINPDGSVTQPTTYKSFCLFE